jgi:hypothetical protein
MFILSPSNPRCRLNTSPAAWSGFVPAHAGIFHSSHRSNAVCCSANRVTRESRSKAGAVSHTQRREARMGRSVNHASRQALVALAESNGVPCREPHTIAIPARTAFAIDVFSASGVRSCSAAIIRVLACSRSSRSIAVQRSNAFAIPRYTVDATRLITSAACSRNTRCQGIGNSRVAASLAAHRIPSNRTTTTGTLASIHLATRLYA